MVTSSTLVGSSSTTTFGLTISARDGDALALAAGELVRVALQERLGASAFGEPMVLRALPQRARARIARAVDTASRLPMGCVDYAPRSPRTTCLQNTPA
jgi:hypothetical protein